MRMFDNERKKNEEIKDNEAIVYYKNVANSEKQQTLRCWELHDIQDHLSQNHKGQTNAADGSYKLKR